MAVTRIVPNLHGALSEEGKAFYAGALGLELAMDIGWIATLTAPGLPSAQVSLVAEGAEDPAPAISVGVDDVDAAHGRAVAHGADVVYALRDEPWGVRRFMVRDPAGTIVNVVGHQPG